MTARSLRQMFFPRPPPAHSSQPQLPSGPLGPRLPAHTRRPQLPPPTAPAPAHTPSVTITPSPAADRPLKHSAANQSTTQQLQLQKPKQSMAKLTPIKPKPPKSVQKPKQKPAASDLEAEMREMAELEAQEMASFEAEAAEAEARGDESGPSSRSTADEVSHAMGIQLPKELQITVVTKQTPPKSRKRPPPQLHSIRPGYPKLPLPVTSKPGPPGLTAVRPATALPPPAPVPTPVSASQTPQPPAPPASVVEVARTWRPEVPPTSTPLETLANRQRTPLEGAGGAEAAPKKATKTKDFTVAAVRPKTAADGKEVMKKETKPTKVTPKKASAEEAPANPTMASTTETTPVVSSPPTQVISPSTSVKQSKSAASPKPPVEAGASASASASDDVPKKVVTGAPRENTTRDILVIPKPPVKSKDSGSSHSKSKHKSDKSDKSDRLRTSSEGSRSNSPSLLTKKKKDKQHKRDETMSLVVYTPSSKHSDADFSQTSPMPKIPPLRITKNKDDEYSVQSGRVGSPSKGTGTVTPAAASTLPASPQQPAKPKKGGSFYNFEVVDTVHIKQGEDGRPRYMCDICQTSYQRLHSLKRHYYRTHINHKFIHESDMASAELTSLNDTSGFREATERDPASRHPYLYCCYPCRTLYDSLKAVIEHTASTHSGPKVRDAAAAGKRLECDKCEEAFTSKRDLEKHREVHECHTFACRFCDQVFPCESVKKRHEKIHNREASRPAEAGTGQTIAKINIGGVKVSVGIGNLQQLRKFQEACKEMSESSNGTISLESADLEALERLDDLKPPGEKCMYQCNNCQKSFPSYKRMCCHMRMAHPHKPVPVKEHAVVSRHKEQDEAEVERQRAADEASFYAGVRLNVAENLINFMDGTEDVLKHRSPRWRPVSESELPVVADEAAAVDGVSPADIRLLDVATRLWCRLRTQKSGPVTSPSSEESAPPPGTGDMLSCLGLRPAGQRPEPPVQPPPPPPPPAAATYRALRERLSLPAITDAASASASQGDSGAENVDTQGRSEESGDRASAGAAAASRAESDAESDPGGLRGEWERLMCFVCHACGAVYGSLYELDEHKAYRHTHVLCCHTSLPDDTELLSEAVFGQYQPAYPAERDNLQFPVSCGSCQRACHSLPELHRHVLECAGDADWNTWGTPRKRKWRGFGARRKRRFQSRRGMKRIMTTPGRAKREKPPKPKQNRGEMPGGLGVGETRGMAG